MTDRVPEVDVEVWDWPVRVVHWLFVVLVAALLTTGLVGGASVMEWHMRAGEVLLALVIFRILWGFVGSRNARFACFVQGPRAVMCHMRSILHPPRQAHAAHNPSGGWMVVALLLALLAQCCLGLFTHDEVITEGPLVKLIGEDLSDALSSLHRRGWWVVAALASLHIAAIVYYLVALNENLIRPMVSGAKRLPVSAAEPADAAASTPRALAVLAFSALAVWWAVTRL